MTTPAAAPTFVAPTVAAPSRAPLLAIALVSHVMIVLDISIVITGLPKIRDGLGFPATGLSWVQGAYTLAFGGLLLLGARAGAACSSRGLALFTIASLAVGLAQSPAWLVGARALQGVGAAVLAPSTLALLSTNFPEGHERTRGYYDAAAGIAASIGQGGSLSPLTVAGIARVAPEDAGAASDVVNVAHQPGGSLRLAVLVVVSAAAGSGTPDARDVLAHRVAAWLTAGTGMLAVALVLVLALIVWPRAAAEAGSSRREQQAAPRKA